MDTRRLSPILRSVSLSALVAALLAFPVLAGASSPGPAPAPAPHTVTPKPATPVTPPSTPPPPPSSPTPPPPPPSTPSAPTAAQLAATKAATKAAAKAAAKKKAATARKQRLATARAARAVRAKREAARLLRLKVAHTLKLLAAAQDHANGIAERDLEAARQKDAVAVLARGAHSEIAGVPTVGAIAVGGSSAAPVVASSPLLPLWLAALISVVLGLVAAFCAFVLANPSSRRAIGAVGLASSALVLALVLPLQ